MNVHLYIHGISMLLEHLVVGFEPAPPTTAELCTTSVNMVYCWEVRSSSKQSLFFICFLELIWLILSMGFNIATA